MIQALFSILLLTVACDREAVSQSVAAGILAIDADTPVVETQAQPAGRNFMNLPSLNYNFVLTAKCATGLLPKTLSLSVADTRKSLPAADIPAGMLTSTSLSIPASQIGPVAVNNFCISDPGRLELVQADSGEHARAESLTISSVLSAQISLLCANDTDSRMIYASKSLGVTLVCTIPPAEPTSTTASE